jgi:hypothetical protein
MTAPRTFRNCRGQVLADSAVGLYLVITGLVLGVVLLLNAGGFTYYKLKLGFIANSTATYASGLPTNSARNGLITTYANQCLQSMGFNPSAVTVTIKDTTIVTRPAVQILVNCPLSTLINFCNLVPSQISLSESAVAAQKYWYWGDGQLVNPVGGHCTFPIVNSTGVLPNDGLPAWQCTLFGATKIR